MIRWLCRNIQMWIYDQFDKKKVLYRWFQCWKENDGYLKRLKKGSGNKFEWAIVGRECCNSRGYSRFTRVIESRDSWRIILLDVIGIWQAMISWDQMEWICDCDKEHFADKIFALRKPGSRCAWVDEEGRYWRIMDSESISRSRVSAVSWSQVAINKLYFSNMSSGDEKARWLEIKQEEVLSTIFDAPFIELGESSSIR
jgi:hypothetical protein